MIEKNESHPMKLCFLLSFFVFLIFFPFSLFAFSVGNLKPMSEKQMREVSGQGLIVSDKISGSSLSNPNPYSTPFEFYRIGLDGELDLNLNISKLQLGCGGINDHLSGNGGCDLDLDYVSLMGREGTDPGLPGSAFSLKRPYIEFAIKNDESTTFREVVGIKIGSESADGAINVGRRYSQNGAINQENTAFGTSCNTGVSVGEGVVGCHSGINSVSGFLGAELSISMRVRANICGGFVVGSTCIGIPVPLDAWGCTGRTQTGVDTCGTSQSDALFVDISGTRMQTLGLRSALLELDGNGLSGVLTDLIGSVYASLNTDLRNVHKLTFEETGDFFLSFQREPVAYPRYSKISPVEEFQNAGTFGSAMDACATTAYSTPRCNSAYSVPANTGWWLNAPSVKLLDVYNDNANLGTLTIGDALSLLGAPGYLIEHPEFDLTPKQNCYGSTTFC